MLHKVKWKVGISNGNNFIEGNAPFEAINGQLSPWLSLIEYLKDGEFTITSLCLVDGDRTFNLPSGGKNPKFRAFDLAEKPKGYNFFRMIGGDVGGTKDIFAVAEAIYSNYKLQLWVDEKDTRNCWVLVTNNKKEDKI